MKKIALILNLIFLTVYSWGQEYTPLLSNSNLWYLTTCYEGCIQDYYHAVDDTIVDGMNHKILDGYHYISRTFLLREIVAEKKIFLTKISPNRIDEYLLYDFSLEEGDEFEMINPITPFLQNGGLYTLDSIRMKEVFANTSRKHFYFSPHPNNKQSVEFPIWVEGSGSLSIINAPGGTPNFQGAGHLQCHYKDNEVFYRYFAEDEICDVNFLQLNPATELVQKPQIIRSDDGIWVKYESIDYLTSITIFNLQGQILLQLPLPKKNEFYIPLHHFAKGIYLLQFKGTNSIAEVYPFLL